MNLAYRTQRAREFKAWIPANTSQRRWSCSAFWDRLKNMVEQTRRLNDLMIARIGRTRKWRRNRVLRNRYETQIFDSKIWISFFRISESFSCLCGAGGIQGRCLYPDVDRCTRASQCWTNPDIWGYIFGFVTSTNLTILLQDCSWGCTGGQRWTSLTSRSANGEAFSQTGESWYILISSSGEASRKHNETF